MLEEIVRCVALRKARGEGDICSFLVFLVRLVILEFLLIFCERLINVFLKEKGSGTLFYALGNSIPR